MPDPAIDFRAIRPHRGSQHAAFEELTCQLAALEAPPSGSAPTAFHRKGAGADAGLECHRVAADASETGWQAKYLFALGTSEAAQLTESFDAAVAGHPRLARFVVCIPFDLSDGRTGRRKSERDRWNDWVEARRKSIEPRIIDIELWDAFALTERLSRSDPPFVGRRTYWFGTPHFGPDWFAARFETARAALGRRYTPELNIELPIRRALDAVARDPAFTAGIERWADRVDEDAHRCVAEVAGTLGATRPAEVADLRAATSALAAAIRQAPVGPTDVLPLERWRELREDAGRSLGRCTARLWELRSADTARREAARRSIYFADKLHETLRDVGRAIDSPEARLANSRRLLVGGEAGVGKSHLLADVTERHIRQGFPAVLLLGGTLVDADPWRQVAEQLGVAGLSPQALLGALDAAAEAAGTRALVIVDAINERNGVAVWADRLAAFLQVADAAPRVAVVVSCRTTFVPYIVRDLDETDLPRIDHPGFAGRSAEAARRYLDERGIVRMSAPNLAPEFENPLFLRTCCDMLELSGERELPRGLEGVSSVFDFYFGAVADAINRRMGLYPRNRIVESSLEALTARMVERGSTHLQFDEASAELEAIHSSGNVAQRSLMFHLESEGVVSVEPVGEGRDVVEMVRFTFERLSDHRVAQRLLADHVGEGSPLAAFAAGGALAGYVTGPGSYRFAGIAEAFAVQLPELRGVELIDAVGDRHARWDLAHGFRLSLLWRRQEFFTDRTLALVAELGDALGPEAVLETLVSIATEPGNRFNADHLHRWLEPLSLADRDVAWSTRVTALVEDGGDAVDTLIQWTLANGLDEMDPARAQLAATALAWLTSLSHRAVRDMATKALATLLVRRRALAAETIRRFASVDDPYVVDRVLAAAYGGAMRDSGVEGLADLARAAFDAVFARDPLPTHALVRDHARGLVELAAARGVLPGDLPLGRARPPYPAGPPLETIHDDTMASYLEDYGGSQYRDEICGSAVNDGDFARYEIDPLADRFLLLPREEAGRSMAEIYEEWRSATVGSNRRRMAALRRVMARGADLDATPLRFDIRGGGEDAFERRREAERRLDAAIADLAATLDPSERHAFETRAAGYLRGRMWNERASAWHPTYAGGRARRWVAWRAHELGWTPERFSDFDRVHASGGRNEHRVERIGKKYQWIALHQMAGRLSDIALLDRGFRDEPGIYEGPWQVGTREMDPSLLVSRTHQRDSDRTGPTWWSPHSPKWGRDAPQARIAWMEDRSRDVPDVPAQIGVTDADGRGWLVLDTSVGRNQWVVSEGDRVIQRMTWHKVRSLNVARRDADRLVRALQASERRRDHPPEVGLDREGYLGEYPWHPAYADAAEEDAVSLADGGGEPVVLDRRFERAGHDYSIEESFDLTLPAPSLIGGMGLRLADGRSLAYADAGGRIVFKDPSATEPGFSAAVVDREAFLAHLREHDLEAVWIVTGEKSAHGGRRYGNGWGGMLEYWGIYRLVGDAVTGELSFLNKQPGRDQLAEFLAHA